MGSDDLHKKRQSQDASGFKRKHQATKEPLARILIVCEDEKSGTYYLQELVRDFGLNRRVKVLPSESGCAPKSVLDSATKLYKHQKASGDVYDRVYCVFDRDKPNDFSDVVQKIKHSKPKNTYFAITTTPCFEFWFLLHFSPSSRPYGVNQNKTPDEQVNSDLKKIWADYDKGKRGFYNRAKNDLVLAISNAKKLALDNAQTDSNNPQTNMHELIKYLQSIKR